MKKSKNSLMVYNMDSLKSEIDFRARIVQYKKLMKLYILNKIEKNNVQLFFEALEDLKSEK